MKAIDIKKLDKYLNENIVHFHDNRLKGLSQLTLNKLLKKNPYLFKAKNIEFAGDLIVGFLDAFLSSSEEKMFGDFLESLAIFIAKETRNGHKSSATGLDLEFVEENKHYLISIKSGPNWGNNAQILKLSDDFDKARRIILQQNPQLNVINILGICYGKVKTNLSNRGYWKLVGQNFWTFISGNKNLYTEIIEPIGFEAKKHNEQFDFEKDKISNKLVVDFVNNYCLSDGRIDWNKLVVHNSGNYDLDQVKLL